MKKPLQILIITGTLLLGGCTPAAMNAFMRGYSTGATGQYNPPPTQVYPDLQPMQIPNQGQTRHHYGTIYTPRGTVLYQGTSQ